MQTKTKKEVDDRILAFIDIGTNSIRLMLVKLRANHSHTILREEKEVVRLGESVFRSSRIILDKKTMDRALLVCKKFVDVAHGFDADEIIAVATSAVREARNHREFITRLKKETNVTVRIISGSEEARLIYLGIVSGVHIQHKTALFVDIGGGSTEIILGDQHQYFDIESLGIGAIRLTKKFLNNNINDPFTNDMYKSIKRHVKNKIVRVTEHINQKSIELAFGSSGTIINLAEIAARLFDRNNHKHLSLRYKDLKKIGVLLRARSLEERKHIPGINSHRADIIIPGAIILETIMEEFQLKEIIVSVRDLRHGLFIDYLHRNKAFHQQKTMSVRESSVLRLARLYSVNEQHTKTVSNLALQLFDSSKKHNLHTLGDNERELLLHAAQLHDVGNFISFRGHHLHSHYIISNAELLGFDQNEIQIMANVVRFHRKKIPRKKEPSFAELDKTSQNTVIILSSLLRLAEKLDRSHNSLIKKVEFTHITDHTISLSITCTKNDCQLERWGVEADKKAFETVFKKKFNLIVHPAII